MKRIVTLVLVIALALTVCVGCGNSEKDYNLATGVAVTETLASSKVAATVASIVTDNAGKIVICRLDCVEYSAYDKDGELVTDAPASKVAQGDNYDQWDAMKAGDWYKQAKALEDYVVGKTQDEVKAIVLEGGKVTDLATSCTINVVDLLKAIDKAFASEHKIAFKSAASAFTAGLVVSSSVKDATDDDGALGMTLSATFATAVMADGAVVAAILDTAEPTLAGLTADGAQSLSYNGTKREQGTDYDAYKPMAAGTWYVQADVYTATAVGKTAANIATLASEGVAGCTINVVAYKAALEAAVASAR
jgi:hypothetical protein